MPPRRVLVPLAVVALAAALFLWHGGGDDAPVYDVPSDVAACAANLREIYGGLILYSVREKHAPPQSGVRFLGALLASGALEDTPANRARLTCPGKGAEAVRAGLDYRALDTLTEADSAYAARDMEAELGIALREAGYGVWQA